MRDGLKIYACSGFGVGTMPDQFDYWLDNTNTLTNKCAVNTLLADINFVAAKLQYDRTLSDSEVLTALNMIDLYTVCLYGAEQYQGTELSRYGRIVGALVEDGAFGFASLDNIERDAHLDELIAEVNMRFTDGEDPAIQNDTTVWFDEHIVALDYVGLSEEQVSDVQSAISASAAISGTAEQDAAVALTDAGSYYLYMYLKPTEARRVGKVVADKRKKESEVYDYVQKAYIEFYGSKEAIDKLIYVGICKQYKSTPEAIVNDIKGHKGIGEIALICSIIASIVTIIATTLSIVFTICGACLQSKYSEPEDPDFGTPGFGGEDLNEIEGRKEGAKGLLGVLAAAALLLYGIFK